MIKKFLLCFILFLIVSFQNSWASEDSYNKKINDLVGEANSCENPLALKEWFKKHYASVLDNLKSFQRWDPVLRQLVFRDNLTDADMTEASSLLTEESALNAVLDRGMAEDNITLPHGVLLLRSTTGFGSNAVLSSQIGLIKNDIRRRILLEKQQTAATER